MRFSFVFSSATCFAVLGAVSTTVAAADSTLPPLPDKGAAGGSKALMVSPGGGLPSVRSSGTSKYSLKPGNHGSAAAVRKFQTSSHHTKIATSHVKPLKPEDVTYDGNRRRLTPTEGNNFLTDVVVPTKLLNVIGKEVPASKKKAEVKDENRRLRGQNKKMLTDFMADIVGPVHVGHKMRILSPDSNRRLQAPECFTLDDESIACVQDGYPGTGFYTLFVDCSSTTSVFDCERCGIFGYSGDPDPVNDPQCSSCTVCASDVAYDCSNVGSGDCASKTCAGVCSPGGDDSDDTGGVSCGTDANGNTFCVAEDLPGTDWLTIFLDCPSTVTNALECGRCTIVPPDDTPLEIDLINDDQCTACTVCADTVSYDCSNLDGGDCSILDCSGNCSGGRRS